MPKAYLMVSHRRPVKNLEAWRAYAKLAGPAMVAAGGRFLARNKPAKTYETGLNESTILVEFDSLEKALAAYDTPAYKQALKELGNGNAERDSRVVEGLS